MARVIEVRSRQPGASLYLVTDFTGEKIAGNVDSVPPDVLNKPSNEPQIVPYAMINEAEPGASHTALVRVFTIPGGFRLLVGRDVGDTEVLAGVVRRALMLTMGLMIVLGLASLAVRLPPRAQPHRLDRGDDGQGSSAATSRAGWK